MQEKIAYTVSKGMEIIMILKIHSVDMYKDNVMKLFVLPFVLKWTYKNIKFPNQ